MKNVRRAARHRHDDFIRRVTIETNRALHPYFIIAWFTISQRFNAHRRRRGARTGAVRDDRRANGARVVRVRGRRRVLDTRRHT